MCKHILKRKIYARSKFSCVRSSHDLCVRAQLRGKIAPNYSIDTALMLCWILHAKALQVTVSKGLDQSPYVATKVGFESGIQTRCKAPNLPLSHHVSQILMKLSKTAYTHNSDHCKHTRGRLGSGGNYLQPCLDVFTQFLLVDWHVVFGQPVTVENWSLQSSVTTDVREVFQGNAVDVLIGPRSLLIIHKPGQQKPPLKNSVGW